MKKLLIMCIFILATSLNAAIDCSKASNTQDFVKRFYDVVLNRAADNAGMDDWTNQLLSRSKTGADIAQGFIFSAEYNLDSKSNTEYLNDLYRAFFDRVADQGGFDEWMSQLNAGTSREDVLHGFLYSQEFINLSNSYGIQAYTGAAFQSDDIDNFVKRFYSVILGREADSAGLADWTNRLSTATSTGADIARGFIFSAEYNLDSKSNTQYINDLYSAFFDRVADQGGFDGWMSQLNSGISRSDVLDGFLQSQEFINLTNSFGILAFEGAPEPDASDNVASVANAGRDQILNFNETVSLDASASTDSDGSIECYWWKEASTLLSTDIEFSKDDFSVGNHEVYMSVVDDSGQTATDTMTVTVTTVTPVDTTKPVITLTGGTTAIAVGGTYTPPTVAASDNVDGDLSSSVMKTGDVVNPNAVGTYVEKYDVTDSAGNDAIQKMHTVVVSTATVSFENDVMPIFEGNCQSCHDTTSKRIFKVGDTPYTHNNIITNNLINTTSPDLSSILLKGNGDSHNGGDQLSDVNSKIVRDWIEEGGSNN